MNTQDIRALTKEKITRKLCIAVIVLALLTLAAVPPGMGGAYPSPKLDYQRIPAYSSRSFTVWFYGGQLARVVVGPYHTNTCEGLRSCSRLRAR